MTFQSSRAAVIVIVAAVAVGCGSQNPAPDDRVAELEKQLADSQKQLADAQKPAEPQGKPAPRTATSGAASAPATGAPASQGITPEGQRLAEQQKAVNEKQAATNVRLQQQVDQLKPREVTLTAGTLIPIRTTGELSTSKLSNGSTFDALLEQDIVSGDTVIAKAGSRVNGYVVTSDPGGRVKGVASLTVGVRSILGTKGNVIAVTTDSYSTDAESTKKKDAVRTGVATGVGALIGGIAGGGKGAAIGAGAGAAAGVGTNMATRGAAAVIPPESLLEFHLQAPVTVVIQP